MRRRWKNVLVEKKEMKNMGPNDKKAVNVMDEDVSACEAFIKSITKDEEDAFEKVVDDLDNNWDAFISGLGE